MKMTRFGLCFLLSLALARLSVAESAQTNSPFQVLSAALNRLSLLLEPPTNKSPQTFTATIKVSKAEGLPKELAGEEIELAYQAPDHARFSAVLNKQHYLLGRDGQELWVHLPDKHFGLLGTPGIPQFSAVPDRKEAPPLGPIRAPITSEQRMLLPLVLDVAALPDESVGASACHVLKVTPKPDAVEAFNLPQGTLQLWLRENDLLPLRITYTQGKTTDVQVDLLQPRFVEAWPAAKWKVEAGNGDKVENIARSHLTRFFGVMPGMLFDKVPPLGPATGERQVVAREGQGRLEMVDGTRVVYLKGTPEEMG